MNPLRKPRRLPKKLRTVSSIFFLLLPGLFLPNVASSQKELESDFRQVVETKHIRLLTSLETAFFKGSSSNLIGGGIRIGVNYGLTDIYALQVALSQTFELSGSGISVLYVGFSAYFNYAISGSFNQSSHQILVDGNLVVEENTQAENLFCVGLGVEEFLLNGSTSVYPATGLAASISYEFNWGDWILTPALRAGWLKARSGTIFPIIFNIGTRFVF